ncbi:MAG TPA: S8 family serine peptidase [Solirubrobacteraceae bacterium]|nr:S8 family serine peptidase [Solirubrobacteraceae bacterium]
MGVRLKLMIVAGAAVSLFALTQVMSASASAGAQAPDQSVIVVFKNQDRAQPANRSALGARRRTLAAVQGPVLQQLAAGNARDVHSFTTLNAVSATVSPAQVSSLRSDPAVAEVVPNGLVHLAPTTTGAAGSASGAGATPLPGACAPPGKVQLEPEALKTMSVDSDSPNAKTARSLSITGSGVTVGFIADAIDPNNPDFIRANGQHVVNLVDFSGFGTAAPTSGAEGFGDASAIAAQGREVYDVSNFSALPLNRPCNIRIEGVAPGVNLVGLVAFGASNVAPDSSILEAIDYAITTAHVNVLNESFGINNYPDDGGALDLIAQANDQAVAAGITVVEATGDAGVTNTTGEAATDPNVISAGASTDNRNYIQDGFGGTRFPEVKGWSNDEISSLSSSGFDQRGRTIDVVAPGESDWALCSTNQDEFGGCASLTGAPSPVQSFGGTSQSSPMTAGVAALVIQAYEKTHRGTAPSPALVKQLIVSNTDDIGAPADQQGSGRVDAYKAVLAAENYNQPASGGSAQGRNVGVVTTSPTQLNAVDQSGTTENLTDTVTNESGSKQHLTFSGRTIGAYRSLLTSQFVLSDNDPQTPDYGGVPINYQRLRFHVPAGLDRIDASAAFHSATPTASLNARVRFSLIDPNGVFVGDSRPQGLGNFGDLQITHPAAGTWTAYVYSRDSEAGGYVGPVVFGISGAKYTSFGTVTPSSATLAPGQSVAVQVRTRTPAQPGDASGAIVVQSTRGGSTTSTTVPVTLRSLIPAGNQTFSGTVTGGNGRAPISGQEFFYQLDVPAGKPELNATITVQDPGNQFGAYLINPQGEAMAYATNMVPGASADSPPDNQVGAQLHTLNPAPGRWRLAVVFAPVVSGNSLSSPFQVSVNQQAVPAAGGGLPNAASTQLTAGQPQTYHVTVKNTGTAPETFFSDARLPGSTAFTLGAISGATDNLPDNDNVPLYLVPTNSTQFQAQATTTGSTPLLFESQFVGGDPDVASTVGTTASLSYTDNPIATGEWDVLPVEYGAFGTTGPPSESVTTSASVVTSPFDATVSSPTGDLESDSANPATSLDSFKPITVGPGQTATIPVTITPSGASGTKVTGTLYLDDTAYFEFGSIQDALVNYPQADQVAALPYQYTIK